MAALAAFVFACNNAAPKQEGCTEETKKECCASKSDKDGKCCKADAEKCCKSDTTKCCKKDGEKCCKKDGKKCCDKDGKKCCKKDGKECEKKCDGKKETAEKK